MNLPDIEPATHIKQMKLNEMLYLIRSDSVGNKIARQLELEREEHFQDLYEFSFGVSKYDKEFGFMSQTEFVAIEIASAKSGYDKRIRNLRLKYERFWKVMKMLRPSEAEVFRAAFIQGLPVSTREILNIISDHISELEQLYPVDDEELSFEGEEGIRLLGITEEKIQKRKKRARLALKELL